MTIILLLAGLGLIVLGADWLVDGASAIASRCWYSHCQLLVAAALGIFRQQMPH